METYTLFFFLALLAEVIGTVSGFGSSILFVPLASLILDFKIVLGVTAVFHVFSNTSKILLFRNGIDKNIVLKLGIPAVLFVILGALLTNYIPQKKIELSMNIIILALSIYLMSGAHTRIQKNNQNLYTGGAISGFLAGLIGTGGAIRGITLAAFQLEKDVFIATSAVIDFGVDLSRAVVYLSQGYFHQEHLILIPFLIIISIVGTYLGKMILTKISEKVFHYLVLSVIIITTVLQTIHYFQD
ncbi:sulfite exporter TauE/SafE family protein [Aquirufa aurantiipilula]|uniref:Probable membrane transporter protein n=1 Tax=Aquirufa aurantiipilula TaxID=2696561 RepID=A0ABT6BLY3_9BACT|nr:sulfite exporter TauE/SafE family protein [Aquirufa aurantiipilula]MBZ1325777.1 sulfite exporter TauE/SafE family protein [Aquirufa aurantiipilula]MDF5691375.1 sulfite exporter TauE/SafE family protein [Aquirufa aurantiipilula]